MGIRGLTTYIDIHNKKFLKDYKLHDCYVIVDGSSIAFQIFVMFSSRAHCAFGGDYDQYAKYIRNFFDLLSQCGVTPIVIFDGGYEPRKIGTVLDRMKDRITALKFVRPASDRCIPVFPLLMKNVVKDVLRDMNVSFVQCDFEADQEIASLARKYGCPVISYDSDFYIYDVSYIPVPSIEFEAVPLEDEAGMEQPCEKFYINCKMYTVDCFLNAFGGLNKSMLPLLGTLLGNDYVKLKVFRKFFTLFSIGNQKPLSRGSHGQKRIADLIQWMRKETFDSAIQKVFQMMKRLRLQNVKDNLMKSISAYTDDNVTIEQHLPPEFKSSIDLENSSKLHDVDMSNADGANIENEMDVDNNEEDISDDDSQTTDESSLSEEDDKDDKSSKLEEIDVKMIEQVNDIKEEAIKNHMNIPNWLRDRSRKGNIEPCVFDILTLRTYFTLPQAEGDFRMSSHAISVPIIKKICKLLLGDHFQNISLYMKNSGSCIQRFLLHLTNTPLIIDINSIPNTSLEDRKALLLQCLDIPADFCLDSFPEEWQLYMCAILFWIKSDAELKITESRVVSLLMSVVASSIIDSKVGVYEEKFLFLKKHGKTQKKIIKRIENGFSNESDCDDGSEMSSSKFSTIKSIYSSINVDECIASYNGFHKLRQLNVELTLNKRAFWTTTYSLAQFQSCLYHVIILNSVFDHPFEHPIVSRLYSSTFVYNMCSTLNQAKSVTEHIKSLLKYSPNILRLVKTMFSVLTAVAPVESKKPVIRRGRFKRKFKTSITDDDDDDDDKDKVRKSKSSIKRNRRKRRKKEIENNDDAVVNVEESDKEDKESYQDENNIYSFLSTE